ncbi:MAG: GntR family transcriptional regulator [Gemmatimonadetes bacterium]|nr:GntR family transcriptional regulator [Gemmatimonadota bacterium]
MDERRSLTDRLRDRIVSALHVGHLRVGERLPSIRQVAAETGEDARAVARAYRALEAEGLVEVRERSGIFAARQARIGGVLLEETAQWAARVLVDGWKRGIAFPEIPAFFQRYAAGRAPRVAFVESCQDVITAFTHDLRERLGMAAQSVRPDSLPGAGSVSESGAGRMPAEFAKADLVVTTGFHARQVAPLAGALQKPLIVATVNAEMVAAVERQIRTGALTVICADPSFGERVRIQYRQTLEPNTDLRVIPAEDARGIAALDRAQPVLLTRAARERLGDVDLPLVFPHSPTLSAASVLEFAEFLIRFNLERAEAASGVRPGSPS